MAVMINYPLDSFCTEDNSQFLYPFIVLIRNEDKNSRLMCKKSLGQLEIYVSLIAIVSMTKLLTVFFKKKRIITDFKKKIFKKIEILLNFFEVLFDQNKFYEKVWIWFFKFI